MDRAAVRDTMEGVAPAMMTVMISSAAARDIMEGVAPVMMTVTISSAAATDVTSGVAHVMTTVISLTRSAVMKGVLQNLPVFLRPRRFMEKAAAEG